MWFNKREFGDVYFCPVHMLARLSLHSPFVAAGELIHQRLQRQTAAIAAELFPEITGKMKSVHHLLHSDGLYHVCQSLFSDKPSGWILLCNHFLKYKLAENRKTITESCLFLWQEIVLLILEDSITNGKIMIGKLSGAARWWVLLPGLERDVNRHLAIF